MSGNSLILSNAYPHGIGTDSQAPGTAALCLDTPPPLSGACSLFKCIANMTIQPVFKKQSIASGKGILVPSVSVHVRAKLCCLVRCSSCHSVWYHGHLHMLVPMHGTHAVVTPSCWYPGHSHAGTLVTPMLVPWSLPHGALHQSVHVQCASIKS